MNKTTQITISIPLELKDRIDEISEKEERTRSAVIARLIKSALKEYSNDK